MLQHLRHMNTMVSKTDLQLVMKVISSSSAHPKICLLPASALTGRVIIFITEMIWRRIIICVNLVGIITFSSPEVAGESTTGIMEG